MQLVSSTINSPRLHPILLGNSQFEEISNLRPQKTFTNTSRVGDFFGSFVLGEFQLPNQPFTFKEEENLKIFRNIPINSFPKIEIILERKKGEIKVKDFRIERSDNSVYGELLYTRFFLMLSAIKKLSLHINILGFSPLEFSFNELSEEEKKTMLFRAKLARKLRFIELFFNISFYLPEKFDASEIRQTEILFRAITEGEFSIPFDNLITIYNYKPEDSDFHERILRRKGAFSFELPNEILLLGKSFSIGKSTFRIEKGGIANPRVLRNLSQGEIIPLLNLNVFDYQIHHKFDKYLDSSKLIKNRQKLEKFKLDLQKEEPEFLVNLIESSLAQDITSEIAIEIVEGLLQFHDFPDRFSVLEPTLKADKWCVPIALTYPDHEPIWLADAFIDIKTGVFEMKISFDELLKKGKKKAKEAMSIA